LGVGRSNFPRLRGISRMPRQGKAQKKKKKSPFDGILGQAKRVVRAPEGRIAWKKRERVVVRRRRIYPFTEGTTSGCRALRGTTM